MALSVYGGVSNNINGASSITVTIASANAGDWIYALMSTGYASGATASSAPGLTFTQRMSTVGMDSGGFVATFAAPVTNAMSNVAITGSFASGTVFNTIQAFVVSGAPAASPFDPDVPIKGGHAAKSFAGVSTADPNTLIFLFYQDFATNAPTAPSGWNMATPNTAGTGQRCISQYSAFSAPQTNITIPTTLSGSDTMRGAIVDAFITAETSSSYAIGNASTHGSAENTNTVWVKAR